MSRWSVIVLIVLALLLAGCDGSALLAPTATPIPTPTAGIQGQPFVTPTPTVFVGFGQQAETARVLRVVDGDTIMVLLDGREERVRYIGLNAPESVKPDTPAECFGHEASEANRRLVDGKTVEMERDVSDRDQYGRLLRFVYVNENGQRIFVNEALIAGGFVFARTYPPDVSRTEQLRAAQQVARDNRLGIWKMCRR